MHTIASGSNSVVECNLAKVDVAGSNPVSRSIFFLGPLAQSVEQVTLNHKVAGSIPARPTIVNPFSTSTYRFICIVLQCDLYNRFSRKFREIMLR